MSRSFGATPLTTRSPIAIRPPEISSSPAIIRKSVDLPQPEGPTSTQNSPSSTPMSTPCTTSVEPKLLRTPERVTDAMRVLDLPGRRVFGKISRGRGQVSRGHCDGQGDSHERTLFDRSRKLSRPSRGHGRGRLHRQLGPRAARARRRRGVRVRLVGGQAQADPPHPGHRSGKNPLAHRRRRRQQDRRPGSRGGASLRGDPSRGPAGSLLQGRPRRGGESERGRHGQRVRGRAASRDRAHRLRELDRGLRRDGRGPRRHAHALRRVQTLRRADRKGVFGGLERRERRHQAGRRLRRGPRPGPHLENDFRDSRRRRGQALRGAFFRGRIVAVRGRGRERVHSRSLARAQGRPRLRHERRLCASRGGASHPQAARAFGRDHLFGAASRISHAPARRAASRPAGKLWKHAARRRHPRDLRGVPLAHSARAVEHARAGVVHETALIVGAGSGLSASLARLFAKDGMRVALAARDTVKLASLAKETSAFPIACDVTDLAQVEAMFASVEAKWGVPDLAVYNAGYRVRGPLVGLDPKEVERTIRVTGYAGFLVAQSAAKRMLPRGSGAIFFTGASASVKGYAESAPFAMGKFALRGLAPSMARELAPKGIHVAHFVIDGGIARGAGDPRAGERGADGMLLPDEIAKNYLHVFRQHRSAWTWEVELRPWVERF